MTMLEKVARSICARDLPPDDTTQDGTPYWKLYVDDARVAVEAMREVDDAFFARVSDLVYDGRYAVSGESYPVFRNYMRGMVDAILNEQPHA